MDLTSLILISLVLVIVAATVALSMAFGWPTVPSVKSSAPKGYATTMDTSNSSDDLPTLTDDAATDEMPTVTDVPALQDPTDFSEDDRFQRMMDDAHDIAKEYDVSVGFVVASLECAVSQGDQR